MRLKDFIAYQKATKISGIIWEIYFHFSYFNKLHPGSQFIRSIDSIGANIAEGFGRYHFADKNKFYYNARGSLYESYFWLELCYQRTLISKDSLEEIKELLNEISAIINKVIRENKKLKAK